VADSTMRPQQPTEDEICAAGLSLIELLRAIKPMWHAELMQEIRKDPAHAANPHLRHDENIQRLSSFEGMLSLAEIWATSPLISKEAYRMAGLTPGSERERLTATQLGEQEYKSLYGEEANDNGDCEAAKSNAGRFVMGQRRLAVGGESYRLISKAAGRTNYKPLEAEEKLHHLMVAFMGRLADLVLRTTGEGEDDALQREPGQNDRSDDSDGSGERAGT
jgi:hypothetical protein